MRNHSWNGREANRLLVNLGDGTFAEAAKAYGFASRRDARALLASDFDRDGDLDFVVNNYRAPAEYFVNEGAEGHFLRVELEGTGQNTDAIGALVWVTVGGQRFMRTVTCGEGYASQISPTLHFGLGEAEHVDSIEVLWPGGRREVRRGFPADSTVRIVEGGDAVRIASR